MRINYRRLHFGMLACVFGLTGITLYMAFAFPYSLVHFKQADTTQLKAVLVVGRHGEVSPPREAFFEALGEQPPEEWFALGGPGQLTAVGKERLYLLGKFLRLQYYERLLAGGNPRRLHVRSADSDRCLESAQALLAGLLPPTTSTPTSATLSALANRWLWSAGSGDTADALVRLWQPKAIHTTREPDDDLLSARTKCLEMDTLRAGWKNSTRYAQLLNEFRHDLQVLRQNTGLAFEDDLEMASRLEEQLRARAAFVPFASSPPTTMPGWYTSTLASRLAHIADVTAGARFARAASQRLFAGRLLDTLTRNVLGKIRSDLSSGVSLLNDEPDSAGDNTGGLTVTAGQVGASEATNRTGSRRGDFEKDQLTVASTKLLAPDEQVKLKLAHQREPAMFVYMTGKAHLSALMNALGVYTSQPHYGAALVLELHFDPVNQIHFLRLFSINSLSHNVLPEPVRVQPLACLDAVECSPQQFERNLRHLTLDKQAWQQACLVGGVQDPPTGQPPTASSSEPPPPVVTSAPSSLEFVVGPTEHSGDTSASTSGPRPTSTTTTTTTTISNAMEITTTTTMASTDKLDESLGVGPGHARPISSNDTTGTPTTIASSLSEVITTTVQPPPPGETSTTTTTTTTTTTVAPETTTTTLNVVSSDWATTRTLAEGGPTTWPTTFETTPPVESKSTTQMTPTTSSTEPPGADSATTKLASRK